MDTFTKNLITTAIEQKRILQFNNQGHIRIGEPHVLGFHNQEAQLLLYQIEGSSSSGRLPEWRRFKVDLVEDISMINRTFSGQRPTKSGYHTNWKTIIAIVK